MTKTTAIIIITETNARNLYLVLGFFADPLAAFPFGLVSLVAGLFRFRVWGIGAGVSTFFARGVVFVVAFRVTLKNESSRLCCVVARALANFFEPFRIRSSLKYEIHQHMISSDIYPIDASSSVPCIIHTQANISRSSFNNPTAYPPFLQSSRAYDSSFLPLLCFSLVFFW